MHPKVECVEMIVNEFYIFLQEIAASNGGIDDEECCIEDDDYVLKKLEKISDKLEYMFYLAKDKFRSVIDLEEKLQCGKDRFEELERSNEDHKQQVIKLKKLLASLKAKLQFESSICKNLTEELSQSKEHIEKLQKELASKTDDDDDDDEWKTKYLELEKINENITYQLNEMREKVEAMEFVETSSVAKECGQLESLKNECSRLHDENNEIAMLLEMKSREYDVLMVECENLRKAQEDGNSSDKTENDFVVLQKKDAECEDKPEDDWKEKYQKLCEDNDKLMASIRSMSEKSIEWENEKLAMRNYHEENDQLENEYQRLLHDLNTASRSIEVLQNEKSKAEKEIATLNTKLDALESQLISDEELLNEESRHSAKLTEKLMMAENFNEELKLEISELQEQCQRIDSSVRNDAVVAEMKDTIASLEAQKNNLLEDREKFKTKYQRLQVYCKANINKGDKSSDGNSELEKYRNKCKELIAANKQLQESLGQFQQNSQANEELEKLVVENENLQSFCNEAKKRMESLKKENAEIRSLKTAHDDLVVANGRLREALREAQQNDTGDLIEQLEALKNECEERNRLYLEAARRVDHLTRENAELKERSVRIDEARLQQSSVDQVAKEVEWLKQENQAQKDHYIEAVRQVESLTLENAELKAHLEQQRSNEDLYKELNWYKEEYQAQKDYNNEAYKQIEMLSQENAQMKEMKEMFDQQFSNICEEARKLREEVTRMKTENETLDATNEQLMDFCNQARQQMATLNQNAEAFSVELERMRTRCDELEEVNERLRAAKNDENETNLGPEEIERVKAENAMLLATNEGLIEFCENAKLKINELENVKRSCDELQHTVNTLRETYEMELTDLKNQVFAPEPENESKNNFSNNDLLHLESELALEKEKLEICQEEVTLKSDALAEAVLELNNTKAELQRLRSHVEEVQKDSMALVLKCTTEVDRLNNALAELTEENQTLRNRCLSYDEYAKFYEQMSPIISEVRCFSDEAYEIVNKLQTQLSPVVDKVHKAVQSDEIFEYYVRQMYENDLHEERKKYDSTLSLILRKIDDLKECSDKVEKEFLETEQILKHYKTMMEDERTRYEGIIYDLRQNSAIESTANEERLKYEHSLAEMQQNQTRDLERYKALVNEERTKYEHIINEMQQNLQHYKSLVDEERTRYERIIFEMQENVDKLSSRRAGGANFGEVHDDERQHYENVIFEYQQKLENCMTLLRQSEAKNRGKETTISDAETTAKVDFYDENATHQITELKLGELKMLDMNMFKPVEAVQEKLPSVKKYYDYCKGVITKEIKDILQPEDDVVGDWAIDQDSEIKVDDLEATSPTESGRFIDMLDELVKRFSITSFSNDYKFDETIEEFPLAFKLAELFQVVVSYYIDSPNSTVNPYALELLKKFRDVAQLVDDTGQPPQPVAVVAENVNEARFSELLITAQRFERENKYLMEAVSFFEDLITEYSNFDSEMHLSELIYRWRENIVFDTTVAYYECAVLEEDAVFPPKCMNEFNDVFAQWKESNVKRLDVMNVRAEIRDSDRPAENILLDVYKILETAKTKLHDLICDLHYVYNSENNQQVNPVEFFEQIEDINHWVEHSLKTILNDDSIRQDVDRVAGDSEGEHHHSHDDYDSQSDGTSDEKHAHSHSHSHAKPDRDTVVELKSLLEESNKKIESLVKELMDVKNSREYNEVQQLHSKLDETLYQLHVRDVHCVELTQELTQVMDAEFCRKLQTNV